MNVLRVMHRRPSKVSTLGVVVAACFMLFGGGIFDAHDLHTTNDDCQLCHVNNVGSTVDDSFSQGNSLVASYKRIRVLETVILKPVYFSGMSTRGPPA